MKQNLYFRLVQGAHTRPTPSQTALFAYQAIDSEGVKKEELLPTPD